MKKIFSFLFAIVFLLTLVSFFSQKSFATACTSAGGRCESASPGTSPCSQYSGSTANSSYTCDIGTCCMISNAPTFPTGLTTTTFCQTTASGVSFTWNPVSSATYYLQSYNNYAAVNTGGATSRRIPSDGTCTTGPGGCSFSYNATYPWYVKACNSSGCSTATSTSVTTKDCTPPPSCDAPNQCFQDACSNHSMTATTGSCAAGSYYNCCKPAVPAASCDAPNQCFQDACSNHSMTATTGSCAAGSYYNCCKPSPPTSPTCESQSGVCVSTTDLNNHAGCPGAEPIISNVTGCSGGACCLTPPSCSSQSGVCVEQSHARAYGTKITGVAPCNPAGTDADPVECYHQPDVIPPATCNTDPAKPQTLLNGTCYNNCSGTCQAGDKNYCSPSAGDPENLPAADNPPTAYGPHDPTGDAYCNASTLGGHGYCCAEGTGTQPPGGGNPNPPNPNGDTIIKFVIGLDGIGVTGDQPNPSHYLPVKNAAGVTVGAGSNPAPVHNPRPFTITINNISYPNLYFTFDKTQTDTNYGLYTGSIDLGTTFASGDYPIVATTEGHLNKKFPAAIHIVNGATTTTPHINMVTGDVAGAGTGNPSYTTNGTQTAGNVNVTNPTPDNKLTIYDYTVLMSCLKDSDINDFDNGVTCKKDGNNGEDFTRRSDLEDNGVINKYDYNLFVREFSMIQQGD